MIKENTKANIKPGYKKTPVGIIPEDWEVKRINDFAEIKGRIGFRGYTKDDIVEKGEGAVSISPSNFKNGILDITDSTYISWFKYEESPEIKVQQGDVLLVKTGSTYGKTCFVQELPLKSTINPQIVIIKEVQINKRFLGFLVSTSLFNKEIERIVVGGAIPTISQKEISRIQLPIPPLPEQKAIADCLSTWDKAIEKLSALIAAKKEQKKGLMQGLFSGELKVENGELIQAKEGEDFLKDWKKVKFNDLFQRVNSKKHQITSKEYLERGQYPIVDQGKLNIVGFSNQEDKLYQNIPVIVFGDHTREIKLIDFNFIIGADGTQLLKNNRKDNISFLYYLLKNTHIPNLGYSRHMRVLITKKFIIPNLSEQNAIAEVLTTADKEIELLEKKLESFKTQKKGLMQVLLTGTKRLVES